MNLLPAKTGGVEMVGAWRVNSVNCVDAIDLFKGLPDNSIHCIMTSPPYFGLRDYNVTGQIGLEQTPREYVDKLVAVFREARRVLRDDGTLWVNLGDSYNASGKGGNPEDSEWAGFVGNKDREKAAMPAGKNTYGLPPKSRLMIPARVAIALSDDGWILRDEIIWFKGNPMPESVRDRTTKAHEMVYMFAKQGRYYYDQDAIRQPFADTSIPRLLRGNSDSHKWVDGAGGQTPHSMSKPRPNRKHDGTVHGANGTGFQGHSGYLKADGTPMVNPLGANCKSVWTINTEPTPYAHFATWPQKLVERMILAGCPIGGIVLDPFMGIGTTALVARRLNRRYLGSDLNPDYVQLSERLLAQSYTINMFEMVGGM